MRVLVIAPKGLMGKHIVSAVLERDDMTLVGTVGPKGRDYIGQDTGVASELGFETGTYVYDDIEKIIGECDGIIDFSAKDNSLVVLEAAKKHKKALMIGTTGFSKEEFALINEATKEIPIVYAANTSSVVNLMYELLDVATKAIGEMSDIEIIEMHSNAKLDAPSGTSKEMGEVIAEALNNKLEDMAVFGRSSLRDDAKRKDNTIGYHSIRSGDIISSHTVLFGLLGERLEITHHAYNWMCFARGACVALKYLQDKDSGMFSFKKVLGL